MIAAVVFVAVEFLTKSIYMNNLDTLNCSDRTLQVMNSVASGLSYRNALVLIKKMNIRYSIFKDGSEVELDSAGELVGPFEIVLMVKKSFGLIVGRKEKVIFRINASGTVSERSCSVVLTGP